MVEKLKKPDLKRVKRFVILEANMVTTGIGKECAEKEVEVVIGVLWRLTDVLLPSR